MILNENPERKHITKIHNENSQRNLRIKTVNENAKYTKYRTKIYKKYRTKNRTTEQNYENNKYK